MSTKKWLSVNGLDAKNLTITDVLGANFIGKNLKVFPFSSESDLNISEIDFKMYQKKLLSMIEKYEKRLQFIVCQCFNGSVFE